MPSCSAEMARLKETLKNLEFPYLGDVDGEDTWANAIAMIKGLVGHGFVLIRQNKNRVGFGPVCLKCAG